MSAVLKIKRRIKSAITPKLSYQNKRDSEQNWQMIAERMGESKNLLDVACDRGFYTLQAAASGRFALGFDILKESLTNGRGEAKKKGLNNVVFLEMALTPENILTLPKFDSVLCLSVFHHFFRLYGEDNAKQMLRDLFGRAENQLFLQIPSKMGKYGEGFSVNFEGDRASTENYLCDIFSTVENCKLSYLGKKQERPPTEPYRYLFVVEHAS